MKTIPHKYNYIYKAILMAFAGTISFNSFADELKQINVEASTSEHKFNPQAIEKTRKKIQDELIEDSRDLVRYTTDVGISDNGRHLKGFAMRGVEGNRVGVSIDGVSLPDYEENSLYSRYGNFNNSRLGIDTELVRGIDIVRGSDSLSFGSGALGGAVNYRTLEARDILLPNRQFGALIKNSYSSKNREWVNTAGLAYQNEKLEAVLLYSFRRGHELKSNGDDIARAGNATGVPDPAKHKQHSYLAKLGYWLTDSQKLSLSYNQQRQDNLSDELSYISYGQAWREANDIGDRKNLNVAYEFFPTDLISYGKVYVDWMKTDTAAINYKGSGTGRPLDEIYDRRMQVKYKRLGLRLDSDALQFGGEHKFSLQAFVGQRDFENINKDSINISYNLAHGKQPDVSNYTIQYPIRTKQYHFSLKDDIRWNDTFSSILGVGYDYNKLSPQELNAECSKACLAEGKAKEKKFHNLTGLAQLKAQLNSTWDISYQLSTGYRVPTASEMYFTFSNPYGSWQSNPNLKSEKSVNHAISLNGENEHGKLMVNLYQTNYRDFLFEQESVVNKTEDYCLIYGYSCPRTTEGLSQQMVNIDKAKIRGIEISGNYHLNGLWQKLPEGLKFYGALGYSKGKLSSENSLLSIQPIKAIIGLDYEDPNGKWGVFSRLNYFGAKKADDAKIVENVHTCVETSYDDWFGDEICTKFGYKQETKTYKWLNNAALTFDMFGYYRPIENITLRAGVYNLFNRQYHTWDALRGINAHSTTNSVDREGYGLQRYYAPGRNFSASVEIRF